MKFSWCSISLSPFCWLPCCCYFCAWNQSYPWWGFPKCCSRLSPLTMTLFVLHFIFYKLSHDDNSRTCPHLILLDGSCRSYNTHPCGLTFLFIIDNVSHSTQASLHVTNPAKTLLLQRFVSFFSLSPCLKKNPSFPKERWSRDVHTIILHWFFLVFHLVVSFLLTSLLLLLLCMESIISTMRFPVVLKWRSPNLHSFWYAFHLSPQQDIS